MSWAEDEGVDYEDSKRPTVDQPNEKTGWVAYYAWDRSGHGKYQPRYLFLPDWENVVDIREHIVHMYEGWVEHAEAAYITIHRGVTPPKEAVEHTLNIARIQLDAAQRHYQRIENQAVMYGVPIPQT